MIVKIIGPRDSRGRMKYARLLMNPERRMDDKRLVHTERWFGACCDMVEAAAMTRKRAAVLIAVLIAVSAPVIVEAVWNPPAEIAERPSPRWLKFTPLMVSELVPFSLKLTVRLLPLSRLTPL